MLRKRKSQRATQIWCFTTNSIHLITVVTESKQGLTHREWSGIRDHTQDLEEHPVDKDLGKGALKEQIFQRLSITATEAHHVDLFVPEGIHQTGRGVQHPMGNFPVEVNNWTTQLDSVQLLPGRRPIKIAIHWPEFLNAVRWFLHKGLAELVGLLRGQCFMQPSPSLRSFAAIFAFVDGRYDPEQSLPFHAS